MEIAVILAATLVLAMLKPTRAQSRQAARHAPAARNEGSRRLA